MRYVFLLFFLMRILPGYSQTSEADLRKRAIADMRKKLDEEVQRNGNGSYEAWSAKLAPLREYWANRILHRKKMFLDDFESPDHYAGHGMKTVLGDLTMRMDDSQPIYQIVRFNEQLQEKGIDLIFGMIPTNEEVFPEKFVDRPELLPADGLIAPYRRKYLNLLSEAGIEVVDLAGALRDAKSREDVTQLTLVHDYHWSNLGVVLAAQVFAERLKRYGFVQKALPNRQNYKATEVVMNGLDQTLKLWPVTLSNGQPFEPAESSPILCIGDSNMQVYGDSNPVKDWLPDGPDHADFVAQISRFTGVQASLHAIQAFTPDMLNREPLSFWKDRKVVIWVADGSHVLAGVPWYDVYIAGAFRPSNPKLILPLPSTVLTRSNSSPMTFTWEALPKAEDYWIDIGYSRQHGDIFGGFTGGKTSKTIDLAPYLKGKPIFVQIFARFPGYDLARPTHVVEFATEAANSKN
jgi:hypothetical protein